MSRSVLVVAPHPDDGEIGMGGTMAALVRGGWRVTLCDITDGEPTPMGTPQTRAREAGRAAEILGVERITLDLPNRYLMDTVDNRRVVAEVIRRVRPDLLFVPYWEDAHPDHVQAARLGEAARFYAKLTRTDIPGEVHYPRRVIHFFSTHYRLHRRPSFLFDVSETFETKMQSVAAYESQFSAARGNLWILDQIRTQAAYFGSLIGVRYAEPFLLREEVGLRTLDGLV
ncbi:MAG: bacillithiol biosynthesis deacetylase BshB1 [Armatimonadota bacterium]|nr:bacillithiol biosynthesis deacetylase BshB1 [Armatimonadota bacterium]MDR5697722.1 bacillithiol biosynthesis deacetylase BshB1 [Armatimonadota bacterium]